MTVVLCLYESARNSINAVLRYVVVLHLFLVHLNTLKFAGFKTREGLFYSRFSTGYIITLSFVIICSTFHCIRFIEMLQPQYLLKRLLSVSWMCIREYYRNTVAFRIPQFLIPTSTNMPQQLTNGNLKRIQKNNVLQ